MLYALFLLLFSFASSGEITRPGETLSERYSTMTDQCVQTCMNIISQVNPPAKGSTLYEKHFRENCSRKTARRISQDKVGAHFHILADLGTLSMDAKSCLNKAVLNLPKGIFEGLVDLGVLILKGGKWVVADSYKVPAKVYQNLQQAGADANALAQLRAECGRKTECRRLVARGMRRYNEMNPDGSFAIPETVVDRETTEDKMKFDRMWSQSLRDSNASKSECELQLSQAMTAEYYKANAWTDDGKKRILADLHKRNPACTHILSTNNIANRRALGVPDDKKEIVADPPEQGPDKFSMFTNLYACKGEETFNQFMEFACNYAGNETGKLLAGGPEIKALKLTSEAIAGSKLVEGSKLLGKTDTLEMTATSKTLTAVSEGEKARESAEFIGNYASKVRVSVIENEKFIALAKQSNAGTLKKSMIFVTQENAIMKKLNKELGNKDIVTALTTFQQERFLDEIAKIKKQYPEVKFTDYQDFKSIQHGIEIPANMHPAKRAQLIKDLDRAFLTANTKLKDEMLRLGIDTRGLGSPDSWFRAGIGDTADRANLAARYARHPKDQPGIVDYSNPAVRSGLTSAIENAENARLTIAKSDSFETLMTPVNAQGVRVPRPDVFDLARKYSDPHDLADVVKKRYKIRDFSTNDAQLLQSYAKSVDEFSPSILIAKRESLDLSKAKLGVVSADFLGMGGDNLHATAAALAAQKNVDAAVSAARKNEGMVTNVFNTRKKNFAKVIGDGSICSGDDCVQVTKSILTENEKTKIMNRIAANPHTSQVRMSFVGPGVDPQYRMVLVTQGENIEKALRKNLEGIIGYDKLKNLTFGLDMNTAKINEGTVNLVIGKKLSTYLSSTERAKIHSAFKSAIRDVNASESIYSPGSSIARQVRFRIVPGPGILVSDDEDAQ